MITYSDDFVPPEKLAEWLGAKTAPGQADRLRAKGVPFDLAPDGKPKVLWSVVREWMCGRQEVRRGPKLEGVRGGGGKG